jgi:predicted CopG family antitoxin
MRVTAEFVWLKPEVGDEVVRSPFERYVAAVASLAPLALPDVVFPVSRGFGKGGMSPGTYQSTTYHWTSSALELQHEKGITESAYNCMHMSKSIRLSEDAYERLAAHKRENETFSDVVLRLAGERSLMELAGILDDDQADAMREAVEERRARRGDDLEAVADELGES